MDFNWELPDWRNFSYDLEKLENILYEFSEEIGLVGGLLKSANQDSIDEILVQVISTEALKTSEIENEYLSRRDIMSSIRNNLHLNDVVEAVKDKKASGIAKLMTDVRVSYKELLTKEKLWEWHSLLTFKQRRIIIGGWREGEEPMQVISGSAGKEEVHFEAPPSKQVAEEMEIFVTWFNETAPGGKTEIKNAVVRSGIAHLYFESIHPFEDGNGRIGRAIAQKALAQSLKRSIILSLSRAIEEERNTYYEALKDGQRSNELTNWLIYFGTTALKAQKQVKELTNFTIKKVRFFDEFNSQINSRQKKMIIKMFDSGKDGFVGGMTAKKYMGITGAPKATATRDLNSLNKLGVFPYLGEARNVNYQVMKDLYSVAIMPPEDGLQIVKELKNKLFSRIGWYASVNSKAHITITEFVADEDELTHIVNQLSELTSFEKPIHLNFEGANNHKNGAVFLTPNENSKLALYALMKRIQEGLKIKNFYNSKDPHLSIGRKLSIENVEIALEIFTEVKLDFECAGIVIRKFNPDPKVRQFAVYGDEIKFLGYPPKQSL